MSQVEKNLLEEFREKDVIVYYDEGYKLFVAVGKISDISDEFVKIEDSLRGSCIISISKITKVVEKRKERKYD